MSAELFSSPVITTPSTAEDYWQLLKPRVMALVVFTGLVGMLIAPGTLHPVIGLAAILCIAVGSGAAGALNMWLERDRDALMERTRSRPLPQGKILPGEALGFGVTLAVGSVVVMFTLVNVWAAFYLSLAILFYVFVYTLWLKPLTPQNIVIGGAAGALPPIIGWAAVSPEPALLPWILFGIIFLWTPPHFWALALYRKNDYAKAGFPMLPNVAGPEATKNQIILYIGALFPLTLFPVFWGDLSYFYGGIALLLNFVFLGYGLKIKYSKDSKDCLRLFFFSILYLFLLFLAVLGDKLLSPSSLIPAIGQASIQDSLSLRVPHKGGRSNPEQYLNKYSAGVQRPAFYMARNDGKIEDIVRTKQ